MSQNTQTTIFGDEIQERVNVETTGRTIRPFKRAIDQIADEYRLVFGGDGLTVEVVDTACVEAFYGTLHADAFDEYNVVDSPYMAGIGADAFGSSLQHARYGKSTDDTITLSADETRLTTTVDRDIADVNAKLTEQAELIDPDSIRKTPEKPGVDLSTQAEIPPKAFIEVVDALDTGASGIVQLGSDDGELVFRQETEFRKRDIRLECDIEPTEFTMFDGSYIEDMANAISMSYADSLSLRFDAEFPVIAEFGREGVMSAELMIAPRVRSDPQ